MCDIDLKKHTSFIRNTPDTTVSRASVINNAVLWWQREKETPVDMNGQT